MVDRKLTTGTAMLMGVLALAHGVYMTITPESWYWLVTGVPDRGPFNQHFIRDIGITYILIGASFILGTMYAEHRKLLWLMPSLWLSGHALFHFWEVLVGICGPDFLIVDFGGVTLPAILGTWLTYDAYKSTSNG